MGAVYKAQDTRLGVHVVLKFLHAGLVGDERARKRFIHEAQAASALDHPNICAVHGIDETDDGQIFIAMRYYDGESLKDRIAKRAPLSIRESFQIAFSIAQGLAAAHRSGVIHRDIKPGNAVITVDGFVKILDFGLAKIAGRTQLTASDTTLGTVAYMSPEQAGSRDVDTRTDLWSLGVVLYEMVTGRLPFNGDIDQAMVYSILSLPHIPVREANPDVPDACAAIIDKCLEKDPDFRYQTADELLDDIVGVSKELGWGSSIAVGSVVPVSNIIPRPRRHRGHRTRIALAATFIIAAAAFATWWYTIRQPSPYTTRLRLAVMPIENRTSPDLNPLVDGISETVSDILELMSRSHDDMWSVPYRRVLDTKLGSPSLAAETFGVNYIVTGDFQRYGENNRITLDLMDTKTQEKKRSAFINFHEDDLSTLKDSLTVQLSNLIDQHMPTRSDSSLWPHDNVSIRKYLAAVGYLQYPSTPDYLDHAIDGFAGVLAHDSSFAEAWARKANAEWREFRTTKDPKWRAAASISAQHAVSAPAPTASALVIAGYIFASEGRPEDAIGAYQKALSIEPGQVEASRWLARKLVQQDRFAEAENLLRRAIDEHPDYWLAQRYLALIYHHAGKNDEATQWYQAALAFAPQDVPSLNNLGLIYHADGEWALARDYLERSFRLNPNCATCSNLGLLLYYQHRFYESAGYYEFALEYCDSTTDDYFQVWGNWGKALYWSDSHHDQAAGAFAEAIRRAEDRLNEDPGDPMVITNLIDYYYFSDDHENTDRMIKYGERVAGNNKDVLFSIGNAYEKNGNRELALRYVGDAIKRGYSIPEINSTPLLSNLIKDERYKSMLKHQSETPAISGGM